MMWTMRSVQMCFWSIAVSLCQTSFAQAVQSPQRFYRCSYVASYLKSNYRKPRLAGPVALHSIQQDPDGRSINVFNMRARFNGPAPEAGVIPSYQVDVTIWDRDLNGQSEASVEVSEFFSHKISSVSGLRFENEKFTTRLLINNDVDFSDVLQLDVDCSEFDSRAEAVDARKGLIAVADKQLRDELTRAWPKKPTILESRIFEIRRDVIIQNVKSLKSEVIVMSLLKDDLSVDVEAMKELIAGEATPGLDVYRLTRGDVDSAMLALSENDEVTPEVLDRLYHKALMRK